MHYGQSNLSVLNISVVMYTKIYGYRCSVPKRPGRRPDFRFAVRPDKVLDPGGCPKPEQIKINVQGA